MATNIPRSLPFSCWDEWISVKNGLFSDESHQVSRALETVAMWRIRGRLPLSVDSTAHLIELRLRDNTASQGYYHRHSESELKLLYSAVTVRAVNGLVDPSQQGIYATSVLTLAEKMGLPGWIVELRHDATHNQMPSLSVLRTAANTLVNWFYDFYWMPQMSLLQSLSASSFPSSSVVNCKTVTSIADGTSAQDSSPTFVTEIFTPLFLASTIKSQGADKYSTASDNAEAEARILYSETANQMALWGARLKELCKASPHAVHSIVHGMLHSVSDTLRQLQRYDISKPQTEWELKVACFWLAEVLAARREAAPATGTSTFSSASALAHEGLGIKVLNVFTAAPFVECLLQQVRSMERVAPQLSELVAQVISVVSSAYGITTTTSNSISTTCSTNTAATEGTAAATGKRKSSGEAVSQGAVKKQSTGGSSIKGASSSAQGAGGIVRLENYPMWPLGSLPGDFSASQLYLVEELL